MQVISRIAVVLLAVTPAVQGVKLLASHFAGGVYTLDFTGNKITQQAKADGCGKTPAWLSYYSADKTLYCIDESWAGSGNLVSYNVSSDGSLKQFAMAQTTGNSVHGTLYGGSNGKGFVATAE
jgi:6-phosphogluconolactonase (cycloisomerase 2 family)